MPSASGRRAARGIPLCATIKGPSPPLLASTSTRSRPGPESSRRAPPTLKSTLLDQLRASHNKEDWYVPVSIADAGLTPEQARWIPKSESQPGHPNPAPADHSVGMLTYHLLFWDQTVLSNMKGEKPPTFSGNNRDSFNNFDASNWPGTATKLDGVLTEIESLLDHATPAQLDKWASTIQHLSAHNAYHTGQMIEIRKLQGSWDPNKGVK